MSAPIITPEEFNTIKDTHTRTMLSNAYYAVSNANAWEWLKNCNEDSFMSSSYPLVKTIRDNMMKLGYDNHSGASFGLTMRQMEFLAKNGKNEFLNRTNST